MSSGLGIVYALGIFVVVGIIIGILSPSGSDVGGKIAFSLFISLFITGMYWLTASVKNESEEDKELGKVMTITIMIIGGLITGVAGGGSGAFL